MDEIPTLKVMQKSKFPNQSYLDFFKNNPNYVSDGFDFPIGKPDAKGYYNAQPFMKNRHLGDDWNANTGGNSDLGHSIFAISNGIVSEVKDYSGGWGNILRIVHQLPNGELRESLYAHCQEIFVNKNDLIKKGDKIATIGNVGGIYYAHLHLEMRWKIGYPSNVGKCWKHLIF
jgi:murein DD-endopeptidase MepM/ murein hydrolase activator NlpD